MNPAHLGWLVVMNFLWAGTYSIFKKLEPFLASGQVVTLRFALASLTLLVLWRWLPGQAPRGRDRVATLVMGVLVFAVAPRLQVEGVQRGKAGDASLLVALEPLVTSIAAALFLGERIPTRRWSGFGLGMIGAVLVAQIWNPGFHPVQGLLANGLFVSSFACETAYSIMGKPLLERVSAVKLLGVALFGASSVNLLLDGPATARAAAHLPAADWWMLVYLAWVCTLGGYLLWYVVIRQAEVSLMALTIFIQPLAGLMISALWLGEPLHWGQFWGALAIIAGLATGLWRTRSTEELPPPN